MRPTRSELAQEFLRGRNCAQCVLGQYAPQLDYDVEETDRFAACFGGGMLRGETCGAVTGALMVLGLACEDPARAAQLTQAFHEKFAARFGSTLCRDLLGVDLSQPGQLEAVRASGKLLEYCPILVEGAMEILDELLE